MRSALRTQRIHLATILLFGLAIVAGAASSIESQTTPGDQGEAGQILSCLAANCHAYRMAFKQSPHSVLDTENIAEDVGASTSCAACHGEPVPREKEPGVWACDFEVFGFGKGFVAHLGYRDVDYDDADYSRDDCRAETGELSFGYRW